MFGILEVYLCMVIKVTVIKSLVVPKIVYISSLMSIPKEIIAELNHLLFKFLWNGTDKVTRLSTTVEPVYNGPVLSGHPLLSGQFSKSRLFAHTNAVFVTCIRRPPLLSGRGHPVAVLSLSFFVIFTCIKRPPLNGN